MNTFDRMLTGFGILVLGGTLLVSVVGVFILLFLFLGPLGIVGLAGFVALCYFVGGLVQSGAEDIGGWG